MVPNDPGRDGRPAGDGDLGGFAPSGSPRHVNAKGSADASDRAGGGANSKDADEGLPAGPPNADSALSSLGAGIRSRQKISAMRDQGRLGEVQTEEHPSNVRN